MKEKMIIMKNLRIKIAMFLMICFISPIFANSDNPNERLSRLTNQRLAKIHPELRDKFLKIKAEMEKEFPQYKVFITVGYRDCKQQDFEFEKGRSRPGRIVTFAKCSESLHNFSLGIDIVPYLKGKPVWEDWGFWKKLVKVVTKYGLQSGGTWKKLKDFTHIEMPSKLAEVKKICKDRGCDEKELATVLKPKKSSKSNNLATKKSKDLPKENKSKSKFDKTGATH